MRAEHDLPGRQQQKPRGPGVLARGGARWLGGQFGETLANRLVFEVLRVLGEEVDAAGRVAIKRPGDHEHAAVRLQAAGGVAQRQKPGWERTLLPFDGSPGSAGKSGPAVQVPDSAGFALGA